MWNWLHMILLRSRGRVRLQCHGCLDQRLFCDQWVDEGVHKTMQDEPDGLLVLKRGEAIGLIAEARSYSRCVC